MTREKGKNTAASIRARRLALAQSKDADYQRVLGRYAIDQPLTQDETRTWIAAQGWNTQSGKVVR